jgi:hypothetical protein
MPPRPSAASGVQDEVGVSAIAHFGVSQLVAVARLIISDRA